MRRTHRRVLGLVIALLLGLCAAPTVTASAPQATFRNPIVAADGADPWLQYYEGNYYLATTTWTSDVIMRKSPTLAGLATAEPVVVWTNTAPESCCNTWAPEFHLLEGPNGPRWYLTFTSGQADTLDYQHLTVLESTGTDPMGPYVHKGEPLGKRWSIDSTYLRMPDGGLYLMWSEWDGPDQSLWIERMSNPWTVEGEGTLIARPEHDWERVGANVNEAPEVLYGDGQIFVIYSASSCDTPDYKLGMLTLTGDPMDPAAWAKHPEPVFEQANGVYGPGHNGFFISPDGTETWMVYHGNASAEDGCSATRSTRAQPVAWNEDGTPNFGEPVSTDTDLPVPSGE